MECTLALLGRRPSAVEAPLCNDSACAHVTAGLAVAAPYCLCHKASLCDMSRHRWLELIGRPELHDPWPMAKGCLKRYSAGKITCLASLRGGLVPASLLGLGMAAPGMFQHLRHSTLRSLGSSTS